MRLFYRIAIFFQGRADPSCDLLAGKDAHTAFTSAFQLQLPCCCVNAVYWGLLIVESLVKVFSLKVSVFLSKMQNPIIFFFFFSFSENLEIFDQNEKMVVLKKKKKKIELAITNPYKWKNVNVMQRPH